MVTSSYFFFARAADKSAGYMKLSDAEVPVRLKKKMLWKLQEYTL